MQNAKLMKWEVASYPKSVGPTPSPLIIMAFVSKVLNSLDGDCFVSKVLNAVDGAVGSLEDPRMTTAGHQK